MSVDATSQQLVWNSLHKFRVMLQQMNFNFEENCQINCFTAHACMDKPRCCRSFMDRFVSILNSVSKLVVQDKDEDMEPSDSLTQGSAEKDIFIGKIDGE
ncbi:hypothetical protein RF11_06569 [Thelohanellus kitauei]|uniref:Uncharacterized protein n=1 Tax=Thelohanellus kitauei TaxID=669202 RepID=A0A0C2JH89_THEKT|nr:hypothetical protein RF11_06569 [Thelohanellus kitauei]